MKNYLNWEGLVYFWNNKVKPLVKKSSTITEDITVDNPKVQGLPEGYVFEAEKNLNLTEVIKILFTGIFPEVDPNIPYILPTITLKAESSQGSHVELNTDVIYSISVDSFNSGKIGTCTNEPRKEAIQGLTDSGSSQVSGSLKIYKGQEQCVIIDNKYTGVITASNLGQNSTEEFTGRVDYSSSTAISVTSYGNTANVPGVSKFTAGTTSNATTKFIVNAYKPSFGNVSFEKTEESKSIISNLGNNFNNESTTEFYYGKTNTEFSSDQTFKIYFPKDYDAVVEYEDGITGKWSVVPTAIEDDYYVELPSNGQVPTKTPGIGKYTYSLIKQAPDISVGPRKYRLILTNKQQ